MLKKLKKTSQKSLPSDNVEYPVGSYVKSPAGYFYIVSSNKRYRFTTDRVLDSWKPLRVILTSDKALEKYRIAAKMKFRNGSLIHNISDGRIYLIEQGKRRHIVNPDVLEQIGATKKDVVLVSLDEIKLHEIGEELK